mmetsp:Transcript_130518/g.325602  ORF Transcript_130518/g.325602 Transcript_130518/m.325602 type:complete len:150 (-) Transcript_130518:187-636(-)
MVRGVASMPASLPRRRCAIAGILPIVAIAICFAVAFEMIASAVQATFVTASGPGRAQSMTVTGAGSLSTSRVPRAAKDKDLVKQDDEEDNKAPSLDDFPKFTIGGMIFFGTIGFIGGGPQLAFIFGISGAGFGAIFEPEEPPAAKRRRS